MLCWAPQPPGEEEPLEAGVRGRTCRTPGQSLVLSGQDQKAWEGPQDHPAWAAIKLGEGEEGGGNARPLPLNPLCSSCKFPKGGMGLRRQLDSATDPATCQSIGLLVPRFSHL